MTRIYVIWHWDTDIVYWISMHQLSKYKRQKLAMFKWSNAIHPLSLFSTRVDDNLMTRGMFSFVGPDDVIKCKHFPRYWLFVRGIHRSPLTSVHLTWSISKSLKSSYISVSCLMASRVKPFGETRFYHIFSHWLPILVTPYGIARLQWNIKCNQLSSLVVWFACPVFAFFI